MLFWDKIIKAKENKSRILIGTTSGVMLEGILVDTDDSGSLEIQTDDKGLITLINNKIEYLSVLDNLTYIEMKAKERGLV